MQIGYRHKLASSLMIAGLCCCCWMVTQQAEARSVRAKPAASELGQDQEEAASAVIPSPNQLFDDELDIQRKPSGATSGLQHLEAASSLGGGQAVATADGVPVYSSHYVVPERYSLMSNQETNHKPSHADADTPSLGEEPSGAVARSGSASRPQKDLKVAESYDHGHGHHHHKGHHHHHHDHHHSKGGWLDMGAYTGKKGSFGWHAKYPVGGKHGHGRR